LSAPVTLTIGRELPAEIQYMPPGVQTIAPAVNGEPLDMSITVTAKYAEVFDRAAQSMIAAARAGKGDFPFGDLNHEDSAASVRPTRFWWAGDHPVTGGVRMDSPWTGTGAASLRNGEYVRWSPQWVFHKTTLEPLGLPVNVGDNRADCERESGGSELVSGYSGDGLRRRIGRAAGRRHPCGGQGDASKSPGAVSFQCGCAGSLSSDGGGGTRVYEICGPDAIWTTAVIGQPRKKQSNE
jgi:hypothetical protein